MPGVESLTAGLAASHGAAYDCIELNPIVRMTDPALEATNAVLNLTLFGRMRAEGADGVTVLPRQRKTKAMLAMLALVSPRPVLRSELTDLLWSRRDREQARASLRQSIHELQESLSPLGDVLHVDRTAVALRPGSFRSDAEELARATVTRPEALAFLQRGALLQDLVGLDAAFDRWLEAERTRIVRAAVTVAESALAVHVAEDAEPAALRAAAERLIEIAPTHEAGWRALMTAHAAIGERAAAIDAFERCSAALAQHAQVTPGPETLELLAAIRKHPAPGATPAVIRGAGSRGVRLGVLPFRTIAGDTEELALGLAEEITTAMSRFRWIYLIATPSLAQLEAELPEPGERLRALGLDFLLEGRIQRGGGQIRVPVRLLDMRGNLGEAPEVVWAERFTGTDADLLTLQDRIAAETVAQVDPQLLLREGRRAASSVTHDLTAYDLVLRAISSLYRFEETAFRSAGELLFAAVERDPDYAAAHAWLAHWHMFLVAQGWSADASEAMRRGGELADRAIMLDPTDARALTIAGHVRAFLQRRIQEGQTLHDRALSLNPNLPLAWVLSGLAQSYAGDHADALRRIGEAERLSPYDPHPMFSDSAALVPHLMLGNYDAVVQLARRAVALNPSLTGNYKGYLSALGHLSLRPEMDAVRSKLLELEPGFTIRQALERSPLTKEEDRDRYAEGLRRAGLAD